MAEEQLTLEELNKKLEEKFVAKRKEFRGKVIDVIRKLNDIDLDRTKHVQVHMDMLILREDLVFEVASLRSKLTSLRSLHRKQRKEKYQNYTTNFDIKLNSYGDKDIFISADLTDLQRQIDIFDNQVDYLKEQIMTCDKLGFSIKHIVESSSI